MGSSGIDRDRDALLRRCPTATIADATYLETPVIKRNLAIEVVAVNVIASTVVTVANVLLTSATHPMAANRSATTKKRPRPRAGLRPDDRLPRLHSSARPGPDDRFAWPLAQRPVPWPLRLHGRAPAYAFRAFCTPKARHAYGESTAFRAADELPRHRDQCAECSKNSLRPAVAVFDRVRRQGRAQGGFITGWYVRS